MTHFPRTIVLLVAYALATTSAQAQELAPLPITPSAERLRAITSLSPFAEPVPPGMPPEQAKESIRVFTRQGRWPILVEYEDGSKYWGEITEIGWNTFKLLNRKTDQEETLSYAGIRGIELVDAYGAVSKYWLPKPSERRRLPRPEPQLSPEHVGYKLAVQKLGVDTHRFVHVDLPKGKVRTGVITQIEDRGFVLKDGIIFDQWISFADLQATPRPVAAVGTRIGQGLKWTGLVLVTIPVLPFAFLFWDGC
jgi:hypothetical protein